MSDHCLNNPHADEIDNQIESDFDRLTRPDTPNAAFKISDRIGHFMHDDVGWYGGLFIGAMHSLAYTSNNVSYIVAEAFKTTPEESTF